MVKSACCEKTRIWIESWCFFNAEVAFQMKYTEVKTKWRKETWALFQ